MRPLKWWLAMFLDCLGPVARHELGGEHDGGGGEVAVAEGEHRYQHQKDGVAVDEDGAVTRARPHIAKHHQRDKGYEGIIINGPCSVSSVRVSKQVLRKPCYLSLMCGVLPNLRTASARQVKLPARPGRGHCARPANSRPARSSRLNEKKAPTGMKYFSHVWWGFKK